MSDEIPGVDDYLDAMHPFTQPSGAEPASTKQPHIPMTDHGAEIATRFKEVFHHYDNRKDDGNRSAQRHLGPSEAGTPCDRRIALSLLRRDPVSYSEGWAAFIGSAVHVRLGDMFVWSSGDSGRYASERRVQLPSRLIPRGTLDLLDRHLKTVIDFKIMGSWSLNRLRIYGPSPTYRVQAHLYGMGAAIAGEDVERVAIVGCPRERSSLDTMYVWEEPYDPQVAQQAMARVHQIQARLDAGTAPADFQVADDCKFCPFHLKAARSLKDGCNGRQ